MKTLYQFLEQASPAEEPKKEDPKLKQAQDKENMLKKRVLMTKMRAVRGGATGIMASHEPDGELVEGVMKMIKSVARKKKEKKAEKAMDAGARAKRKLARKAHAKYVSGSEDNVPDDIRETTYEKKKTGEVLTAFKRDPKVRKRFEKAAKKDRGPGSVKNQAADSMLQTAKDIAKRKGDTSKSDDRYAYEEVQLEAKVDAGKSPEQKEKDRNVRKFGVSHNVAGHGKLRRALHRSDRGDKKIKGDKSAYVEMEAKKNPNNLVEPRDGVDSAKEVNRATRKAAFRPFNKEDKAYDYVVSKLKKKYGDGVLTKRDKIKPQSAADKAKARAHQAKVDAENAAERAKDPSQGRYPKG